MNGTLRTILGKVGGIPEPIFLWVNVGLACFVALAHGGALAITYAKPTAEAEGIRQLAMFSLPIATVVIVTAVAALVRATLRRRVLGLHGFVLAGSAVAMLLWALGILLKGIPEGNFSWGVGLLSVWVCYSFLILCRFSVPSGLRDHPAIYYAPLVALGIAAPVDVGVFIRLMGIVGTHFGQ
jgi:hypothetical protein